MQGTIEGDATFVSHVSNSDQRFGCPKKYSARYAIGQTGDIQAVMIAVNEIDVGVSRRTEKHVVARGAASGRVSGGVILAEVGFHFHNACRQELFPFPPNQQLTKQVWSH